MKGDGIEIDLTGSADQVETGFNVPFEGSTKVACFCAIRSLLLDAETSEIKVPSNQGSFRPINVFAPKGSIYNPEFPAAAEARFAQINRVIDLIYKALAPVLPDDIIAGSSASLSFVAYSGIRPSGDYWVFLEVNEGSYGGRPRSDGPDSIDNLMANTRNNPLEDLAVHLPMICDRYELRDDVMPGAGRYRGGIGCVKEQRMLTDGFITHENERHEDVPWGIFGGHEGATGRVELFNIGNPSERKGDAGEVLRNAAASRRRARVLWPVRRRIWRPARPTPGRGAGGRPRRLLHLGARPAGPTAWLSIRHRKRSTSRRRKPCAATCGHRPALPKLLRRPLQHLRHSHPNRHRVPRRPPSRHPNHRRLLHFLRRPHGQSPTSRRSSVGYTRHSVPPGALKY